MATPFLKKILIVDDEHDVCTMARFVLEKIGNFEVNVCGSGSEALAAAQKLNPDLILLDVMMPEMDGPTTLKTLKATPATSAIPVIFLTGKVQSHEVEQYKELGAIDVIPKPFDPMTLSASVTGIWDLHHRLSNPEGDLQAQLNILRKAYVEQVPGKIEHIREKWRILHDDAAGKETLKELYLLAHRLAGSCETFGFSSLRKSAYKLEFLFSNIVKGANFPSDVTRALVNTLLDELALAGSEPPQLEPTQQVQNIPVPAPLPQPEQGKLVYLTGNDAALAQDLTLQLSDFGYTVESFGHLAHLEEAARKVPPDALIMESRLVEGHFNGGGTIKKIQQGRTTPIPVLFISDHTDVDTRLRAVHAGGHAYFIKPLDIKEMAAKLDKLISDQIHEPYRILIIEDEPSLAKYYAAILEQAGMVTAVAVWAAEVVEALVEFKPDLILMDFYLPDYNGIDLAGMIRQQEIYVGIPIVFLSGEGDINIQLEAMHVGADDFLKKPIDAKHLVAAISPRVQRARILRSFVMNDSLTGLFNHAGIQEQINIEVSRASRSEQSLTFTMIDIDNFKTINQEYGHLNGDRVLKSLGQLIRKRLLKTDSVGRYGGDEFGILLTNTDGTLAQKIIDGMREDFSKVVHEMHSGSPLSAATAGASGFQQNKQPGEIRRLTATFSAGTAVFNPKGGDASTLNARANKALQEAKDQGHNRLIVSSE